MAKLLVKNIPQEFTDIDKDDFLKLFGASETVSFSSHGKMRNCCYVLFPDSITAKQALDTLHQFEVFGKKLTAEYAKPAHEKLANQVQSKNILEKKITSTTEDKIVEAEKQLVEEKSTGICPRLNVNHEFPSHLHYKYPDPNITILTNIANAMATVPKFYTQVLHLMNKMNLPAPFAGPTVTPPLSGDPGMKCDACVDTCDLVQYLSSEESELESDSDNKKPEIYQGNQLAEPVRKRKRLKALNKINQEKFNIVPLKKPESVESAFEVSSSASRMEFNLASSIKEAVERKSQPPVHFSVFDERGEFGKMERKQKEIIESESEEEELSDDDDNVSTEYVNLKQLEDNRISQNEILAMAQFKNYSKGKKTNRLYIKNLAKQVTEKDLMFIFKRFVRKCSEEEMSALDIRLMQEGRMKGQAFITLPSEEIAEKALILTHGYVLHDKPMVIQYGRAGK